MPRARSDLRWAGAIVSRDGIVEETGLGAAVLDDPVTAVIWLAERLATQGDRIRAGEVVLSGSFHPPNRGAAGVAHRGGFRPVRPCRHNVRLSATKVGSWSGAWSLIVARIPSCPGRRASYPAVSQIPTCAGMTRSWSVFGSFRSAHFEPQSTLLESEMFY